MTKFFCLTPCEHCKHSGCDAQEQWERHESGQPTRISQLIEAVNYLYPRVHNHLVDRVKMDEIATLMKGLAQEPT